MCLLAVKANQAPASRYGNPRWYLFLTADLVWLHYTADVCSTIKNKRQLLVQGKATPAGLRRATGNCYWYCPCHLQCPPESTSSESSTAIESVSVLEVAISTTWPWLAQAGCRPGYQALPHVLATILEILKRYCHYKKLFPHNYRIPSVSCLVARLMVTLANQCGVITPPTPDWWRVLLLQLSHSHTNRLASYPAVPPFFLLAESKRKTLGRLGSRLQIGIVGH